jgi:sugar lactone lactonase YvrE
MFSPVDARRLELGEGARAVADGFVFVDLLQGQLFHVGSTGSPTALAQLDVPLGAVAPCDGGGWLAAAGTGIALVREGLTWLHQPEVGAATPMRMNDGVVDPHGRFWAGSMAYDGTEGAGSLYRLDPDLSLTRVMEGLTVPNGPAFNAAGDRMYLADSALRVIYRCRVDVSTGTVTRRDVFAQVQDGSPDGMTVDAAGFLWSAIWGGHRLHRYAPDGTLDLSMPLTASQPTSIAITPTTPASMLVTTATYGLSRPRADDGRLLKATAGVPGLAARTFTVSGTIRGLQ